MTFPWNADHSIVSDRDIVTTNFVRVGKLITSLKNELPCYDFVFDDFFELELNGDGRVEVEIPVVGKAPFTFQSE